MAGILLPLAHYRQPPRTIWHKSGHTRSKNIALSGFSRALAVKRTTSSSQEHLKRPDAGAVTGMSKEWIANLAEDIKQKSHEAAENYGREQHKEGIITKQGASFFTSFVLRLEEDVNEIKRELQGDVTAADTTISGPALQLPASNGQTSERNEVTITRSRFPWFDARITHQDATIVLDYAKGLGVAGDPNLDRRTCHFAFDVADDDTLSIYESFGDTPRQFRQPEQLAQYITELLFQV
jgi:hypothetical protein